MVVAKNNFAIPTGLKVKTVKIKEKTNMANVSEKFGLRPYRKLDGTPLVGAQNRYTIKRQAMQTAIFQGDLVKPLLTGHIERHTANTSDAVVGVFNGVFYNDPTTQKPTLQQLLSRRYNHLLKVLLLLS